MNLLEIWIGWKKLGFWTQMGIYGTFGGLVFGALSLSGVHMHLIDLAFLFLLGGCLLLIYGNIQQSRKLANAEEELGTVNTKIDQATKAVYDQKNEEIKKLEIEVATWKDRVANVNEERIKSEQLLGSERDKLNSERDELTSKCQWLHDELAHAREQVIKSGKTFYFTGDEIQSARYVMSGSIVDDRTLGEKRFSEIEMMLKKHKTG